MDPDVGGALNRSKQFTFDGKENSSTSPRLPSCAKEKLLNEAGAFLEANPFGLAVIVADTAATGKKEENLRLSQARAMVVRQYLAQKFKLDDSRIKTQGAGEDQAAGSSAGRVTILVYPGRPDAVVVAAKNK